MQAAKKVSGFSRAHENDLLIVANNSDKSLTAKLWLSDATGKRWNQNLTLSTHQTLRLDFRELLLVLHLGGSYGGIGVEASAYSGALHAIHIVYDEQAQTAGSLKMVARDPAATLAERIPRRDHRPWTAWATMVPLQNPDPALGLPSRTTLQPVVLVRNVTAKPIAANLGVSWHGGTETPDGSAKLGDLQLAAYETRQIQIGSGQKSGIPETATWATVSLSTPGAPDDVVAFVSSHDSTGRYGTDGPFTDAIGSHFAGGEWRADATHDTVISVTNAGATAAEARLTLHYDKGEKKYEVQRKLQPGQQMWLRLADLIQRQVADRSGNTLPPSQSNGTFEVQVLEHLSGGLLVGAISSDNPWGSRLKRASPLCCGIYDPRFSPSFFDLLPADIWNPFETVANDACTSAQESIGGDMISFWTANSAVAQMTSSGVKGLAVGSTTGEGESDFIWVGAGNNCVLKQVTPTAPVTVEQPYDLQVNSDVQQTVNCGTSPSMLVRQITYNVLDTAGHRMQTPFDLRENVPTNIISSCNQHVVQTGATCTSNILYEPQLMGEFTDFLSPGCPSSPNDSPCGFKFTNQQWQWCQPSGAQTSIGTIGPVNAESTLINVDGNVLGFGYGTIFLP